MNILFLCTSNLHRSRTAEDYFREACPTHQYRSAGLSEKFCRRHNTTLCTEALLEWADHVYVMEAEHIARITAHTAERFTGKITNLDIADIYAYMDPALISVLRNTFGCCDDLTRSE